ncbi:uncharacterized protein LOC126707250 isoform X2 [Quercus robur]|uniref:uncharacterized protein LOC126707250 isoform X2 n=1 Tax=Quercus robur TaxID=38942 RepID=UPI002161669C|nr:uncharacterized protein LOC126707250 isoform X2 [Quercus robur]
MSQTKHNLAPPIPAQPNADAKQNPTRQLLSSSISPPSTCTHRPSLPHHKILSPLTNSCHSHNCRPLPPPYLFLFPHHTHTHTHFDFCLGQKDAIEKGLVSVEDVEMATSQGCSSGPTIPNSPKIINRIPSTKQLISFILVFEDFFLCTKNYGRTTTFFANVE